MEEKLHRRWVKIGGKKGSIFNGNFQPVTCTKAIPIGIINRFINWHDKHVNSILKSHKGK